MDMRTRIDTALKDAMRAKEADRLSTLRLINAAIKDREIAARGGAEEGTVGDTEVLADIEGDTILADPRASGHWRETACEMHLAQDGRPAYRFVTLERAS